MDLYSWMSKQENSWMVKIHPQFTEGECDSVYPSLQSVWVIHPLGEDLILNLCPAAGQRAPSPSPPGLHRAGGGWQGWIPE